MTDKLLTGPSRDPASGNAAKQLVVFCMVAVPMAMT